MKEIRKLKEKESTTIKQNIILDIIEDEMQKMISEKKSSSKPLPNHNSKALSIRKEKKSRSSKLFDGNYKIELRQKKITQVCADLLSNRQDFDNSEFKAKR